MSKALAAAAPVTALTFSSAGGITTGSRRYADVSGVSPVGFVPGPKFRPVPAERTMINFVSFDEHTLEIDVFNPPRKAVLDHAQGSSMRERLPGLPG